MSRRDETDKRAFGQKCLRGLLIALCCTASVSAASQFHYLQWGGLVQGDGPDVINAVARDPSGNFLIVGTVFASSTNFAFTGTPSALPGDAVNGKAFVAKYDASGNLLWVKGLVSSSSLQRGDSVATDSSGNIYVAGRFGGTATIASLMPAVANGTSDLFLAAFDASGNTLWTRAFSGSSVEYWSNHSIAIDALGNLVIAGQFGSPSDSSATLDLGAGLLGGSGKEDFLAKLDSSGNAIASRSYGVVCDDASNFGNRVDLDANGNVYTVDSYGASGCSGTNYARTVVYKWDGALNGLWSKTFSTTTAAVNAYSLSVDAAAGIVAIGGDYAAAIDFGAGTLPFGGSSGNVNGYLLQLNSDGTYRAATTAYGAGNSRIFSLAYDSAGRLSYGLNYTNNYIDLAYPQSQIATANDGNAAYGQLLANQTLAWVYTIEDVTIGCTVSSYGAIVPISYDRLLVAGTPECGQVNLDFGPNAEIFDSGVHASSFLMQTLSGSIFFDGFE